MTECNIGIPRMPRSKATSMASTNGGLRDTATDTGRVTPATWADAHARAVERERSSVLQPSRLKQFPDTACATWTTPVSRGPEPQRDDSSLADDARFSANASRSSSAARYDGINRSISLRPRWSQPASEPAVANSPALSINRSSSSRVKPRHCLACGPEKVIRWGCTPLSISGR